MTRRHRSGRWVARTLATLYAVHGARCGRCGGSIDPALSGLHPAGGTIGHIVPLSRGGDDRHPNLRPEHRRCNVSAGDGLRAASEPSPAASIALPWSADL